MTTTMTGRPRARSHVKAVAVALVALNFLPTLALVPAAIERPHPRSSFLARLGGLGAMFQPIQQSDAFAMENMKSSQFNGDNVEKLQGVGMKTVAYHPLTINVDGVSVPVAAWHLLGSNNQNEQSTSPFSPIQPASAASTSSEFKSVTYKHRISVKKIGKMLAGWDFIPSFAYRDFPLRPTSELYKNNNIRVVSGYSSLNNDFNDGKQNLLPESAPVVILAHGYLGSRFDLSHLAEALASEGFLVLSPEYPESLADSYDPFGSISGVTLGRTAITSELQSALTTQWKVQPTAYGIAGHSLGCGTVERTGDETWTRVSLAGYPSSRGKSALFVGSTNDGAVPLTRALQALGALSFSPLDEQRVRTKQYQSAFPKRSYLIFEGDDAPNHISFLAEGTCDAMVEFLSPLLPVARALGIPVLDFDKYQVSRDSRQTGEVLLPLVTEYLKQMMSV